MTFRVFGFVWLGAASAVAVDVDGLTLPFKLVRLSSGVQEIIAEINVREGDPVKKDQVLARLHDEKERAEHERAERIVEKRDFDSKAATALVADKITSREKALEAEIELKVAKVDVQISQRKIDEKTIKSPLDGIIVRKLKEEGESVDRVEPLFEIINIDQLYLQFYVERSVAAGLEPGREIAFWLPGESQNKRKAKVDFVSPGADAASGL
ncbi:MAG TPA: efflux RND transporter periplasmic adaptor subunit, partial [Verrucomicrobiaceae bacterium]